MSNEKTVSVIIPVYRIEEYLLQSLKSISSQNYVNLEILPVTDGSPDESSSVCDESSFFDSRITVIHKRNGGVSSARNIGLEASTGDYIGFVDGDDIIEPQMYETLVSLLEAQDADLSVCGFCYDYGRDNLCRYCTEEDLFIWNRDEMLCNLLTNTKTSCGCWDKLFRRDLAVSVRFDEKVTHYEDLLYLYQVMKNARRAACVTEPYYHYCIHEGSAAVSAFSDKKMSMMNVCELILADSKEYLPAVYPFARQEFVRNSLMCAAFAVDSHYENRVSLSRLQKNVRKNLFFYLGRKVSFGYKMQAIALSVGWLPFRLLLCRGK